MMWWILGMIAAVVGAMASAPATNHEAILTFVWGAWFGMCLIGAIQYRRSPTPGGKDGK